MTKTNRFRVFMAVAAAALVAMLMASGLALAQSTGTIFTVNSTADPGTGGCNATECTLREAIDAANSAAGDDTINFAIPGNGPHTILPTSGGLPTITEAVTINGYSQGSGTATTADDAEPNTATIGTNAVLKIELNGTNAGIASGLIIEASNVVVRGLVINRFQFDGISIQGGVQLTGARVEGNFIGTDPSGTQDLGNSRAGVFVFGEGNNTIGGASPKVRNVISGNGLGVAISASGNEVSGNLIGTRKDGTTALGNDNEGVGIGAAPDNTVGGASSGSANTIAFNGRDGVSVTDGAAIGNRILSNSIFSNGDLGIDLGDDGPTPNDKKDPDTGPNNLQNFPVLTEATTSGGTTTIKGKLNSRPRKTFTIQFFSNPSSDASEGKKLIGQTPVKTSPKGNGSFTFLATPAVNSADSITATATNEAAGDTSEFSDPLPLKPG